MKKNLLVVVLSLSSILSFGQGIGVNDDGAMPAAGTMLDVKATTDDNTSYGMQIKNNSGTAIMVVRSEGNVGIGTNDPRKTLDININGTVTPATGGLLGIGITNQDLTANSLSGFTFRSYDAGGTARHGGAIVAGKSSNWVGGSGNYPGFISFWTRPFSGNQAERMRIIDDGNVGIGTATPANQLQLLNSSGQSSISIGQFRGNTTNATGVDISAWSDGNVYYDTKLATGGKILYRYGEGAVSGTGTTWATMDGGNFGLGTTSPVTKLHQYTGSLGANTGVTDMLRIELNRSDHGATPSGPAILFKDQDTNNGTNEARIKMSTVNDTDYGDNDEAASNLIFETTNGGTASDKMIITGRGNIGIGTLNPTAKLHVNYGFTDNANTTGFYDYNVNTANITATRQMYGGNFTVLNRQTETDPAATHSRAYAVNGTAYSDGNRTFNWLRGGNFTAYSANTSGSNQDAMAGSLSSAYNNNSGTVTSVYGAYNQGYANNSGNVPNAHGSYNLAFLNSPSTGNITNAYGSRNYIFKHGNATGNITTAYGTYSRVRNSNTTGVGAITTAYGYYALIDKHASANNMTTSYGIRANVSAGATRYGVYTENETRNYFSNNVGIGDSNPSQKLEVNGRVKSNGINETSDERLKKDVESLDNALDKLTLMRGVSYKWKTPEELLSENIDSTLSPGTKRSEFGFIAQELEKIFPELVDTDNEGFKSVQYSKVVAILTEALKEEATKRKLLEQDKNLMKQELNILKAENDRQSKEIEHIKSILDLKTSK